MTRLGLASPRLVHMLGGGVSPKASHMVNVYTPPPVGLIVVRQAALGKGRSDLPSHNLLTTRPVTVARGARREIASPSPKVR